MTMKKILMAAVAVTALTAGAANAASITSAKVSDVTVVDTVNGDTALRYLPYRIASETKIGANGITTLGDYTKTFVTMGIDQGKIPGGVYNVSFTYTGPVGFTNAVAPADLISNATGATCLDASSVLVVDGGQALAKTVKFQVTLPAACSLNSNALGSNSFKLQAPLTITGLGSVTVTAGISTSGTAIDNGDSTARTLIENKAGWAVSITPDTVPTYWALAGTTAYTDLKAADGTVVDRTLGKYTVNYVTPDTGNVIYASADKTRAVSGLNLTATGVVTGDVAVVDVKAGGTSLTANGAKTSASNSVPTGDSKAITVAAVSGGLTASQSTKSYSLTVTPASTDNAIFTVPSAISGALQDIGLEGTSLLAPWVAGKEQTNFTTSIRLVNTGSSAVAAITLQIKAPITTLAAAAQTLKTATCTSTTLPKLAGIEANKEIVLSKDDFEACFGSFKRADVLIVAQGANTNLSAKMRNVDSMSSANSEISLGGLKQTGLSY